MTCAKKVPTILGKLEDLLGLDTFSKWALKSIRQRDLVRKQFMWHGSMKRNGANRAKTTMVMATWWSFVENGNDCGDNIWWKGSG